MRPQDLPPSDHRRPQALTASTEFLDRNQKVFALFQKRKNGQPNQFKPIIKRNL